MLVQTATFNPDREAIGDGSGLLPMFVDGLTSFEQGGFYCDVYAEGDLAQFLTNENEPSNGYEEMFYAIGQRLLDGEAPQARSKTLLDRFGVLVLAPFSLNPDGKLSEQQESYLQQAIEKGLRLVAVGTAQPVLKAAVESAGATDADCILIDDMGAETGEEIMSRLMEDSE